MLKDFLHSSKEICIEFLFQSIVILEHTVHWIIFMVNINNNIVIYKAANNFFFPRQVICQVRDQTWPDKETIWSDKKNSKWKSKIKNLTKPPIFTALIAQ